MTKMTHTPYCQRGDSLSCSSHFTARISAAVNVTDRVCRRNSQILCICYTSISSKRLRSRVTSCEEILDSFKKAAIRSPAAPL